MKLKKMGAVLLGITTIFTFSCMPAFAESMPSKEETVYAVTQQDGSIDKITVSERLKTDKKGTVKDESGLDEIKNVKGDETFTQDGNFLEWKADGKDIYYQGKSYKDMPVEMKVKFYLNGIKRSPEKMAGKSGRVKIVIEFNPADGVPFAALSAMSLPQDSFSNISVSNGDVISNGNSYYVAGIALPGLESITSKLDRSIGGNIVVEADCKDFEVSDIYTVLTNEEIGKLDTAMSVDELSGDVEELVSAAEKLKDGAAELSEGLEKLDGKYADLDKAIGDLSDGTEKLDKNMEKLSGGVAQMAKGSKSIYDGMVSLKKNLDLTYKGVKDFSDLADALGDIDLEEVEKSIGELDSGIGAVQSKIYEMQQVTAKETELLESQEQIISQLKQIKSGYEAQGIPTDSLNAAISALEQVDGGLKQTNGGEAQYESGIYDALAPEGDMRQGIAGMKSKIGDMDLGDTAEITKGITKLEKALKKEAAGADKLAGYQKELTGSLNEAAEGAGKLAKGTSTLKKGASQLKNGSGKVAGGIGKLNKGGRELSEGMTKFNEEGIGQISGLFNDARSVLNDFNGAVKRAKAYESYGGNGKGQDVKTRFVIRTKGITE